MLWPAALIHTAVLLMALSRTGLALAVLALGLLALWRGSRMAMASGAVGLSVAAVVYPVFDPGFVLAGDLVGAAAEYVSRGESPETMRTLTGRTRWLEEVRLGSRRLMSSFFTFTVAILKRPRFSRKRRRFKSH